MAAYNVVIYNSVLGKFQIPQVGDTYALPKDVSITGALAVSGAVTGSTFNGIDLAALNALASSALQPGANISTLTNDSNFADDQTGAEIKTALFAEADTNNFSDASKAKVDFLTVTQAVDLDTMESTVDALNTAETARKAVTVAITANAGGGFASAPELTTRYNVVNTVASPADSVKLPAAVAGLQRTVRNAGANALDLFPGSGDNINGTGVDTAVSVAAGSSITLFAADDTNWYSE